MTTNIQSLALPSIDPKGSEALRRAIETEVATFDEMDVAVGVLTQMMERLMSVRERILVRMRKTGQLH